MTLRHVSLDFWRTLVDPNPEFGAARDRFLASCFPERPEKTITTYRAFKDHADRLAEAAGAGYSSAATYTLFVASLGHPSVDWQPIREGLEKLFLKHPPIIPAGLPALLKAVEAQGLGLSIASNTNFMRGRVLTEAALSRLGVDWRFMVFSDEIERSKPHPRFWKEVKSKAWSESGARAPEVLHIGDNEVCDGSSRAHGLKFQRVTGPADTVQFLEGML